MPLDGVHEKHLQTGNLFIDLLNRFSKLIQLSIGGIDLYLELIACAHCKLGILEQLRLNLLTVPQYIQLLIQADHEGGQKLGIQLCMKTIHMNRDIKFMRFEITRLEEEIKQAQMKRFGLIVNLDELEEEVLRRYVFELETTAEEEMRALEKEVQERKVRVETESTEIYIYYILLL